MKKNKLIKGLDNDIYNDFVSLCHKQGLTIAKKLTLLMERELLQFKITQIQENSKEADEE